MCGITGIYHLTPQAPPALEQVQRMVAALTHRGPEQFGVYRDARVALGHARLSILDIAGGQQPLHNEDKSIWIVYNGETFNFLELREELLAKGHVFATRTDTEVLVHLYEEEGPSFIARLNGQYAFALWDGTRRQLMLGRDRVGIRPLYYTIVGGSLIFGSEAKAIFMDSRVTVALDPVGLDQFFTFWATVPPRTTFKNILEVPPAQYLIANEAGVVLHRYWGLQFPCRGAATPRHEHEYAEQLEALLLDATRLRLRADVPVAAYLSGGLDSSLISALVKKNFNDALETFSVSFTDTDFDESLHQKRMADFLGTRHHTITCTYADIGEIMPEVVWHAEQPLIRTAPAPMYLLARLVREHHIKVVLTGEGADEVLGGYDLFKEMMIRRFWARNPASKFRPQLLKKLYGYLPNWPRRAPVFLEAFYRTHLAKTAEPHYSHMPRWETTAGIKSFFSDDVKQSLAGEDAVATFLATLPAAFSSWDYLAQAQYLEMQTLLSGNLLSSQGDRMAMAHSVEGRYPFLDYRVIEFCAQLPPRVKLKGMNEKHLLKTVARNWLPDSITSRVKQAYRSPDSASFFNAASQGYVAEVLSTENLRRTGYFNPALVENLVKRCRSTDSASFSARHNMAITGIITTLLVDKLFVQRQGSSAQPGQAAFYIVDRVA